MKEIWQKFIDKCKEMFEDFIENIKKFSKETFQLLKQGCILFVQTIFKWLWELLKGISSLVISFLKFIYEILASAIKSSFSYLYEKIINWIQKW